MRSVLLDLEPMLDVTTRRRSGYVELGLLPVSPDDRRWPGRSTATGDEVYELRFRDLATGEDLEDVVPRSYYGGAWSADSAHFFYTVHDDGLPARSRSGGTSSARRSATTCWCSRSPTSASSSTVRATRSGGAGRDLVADPRHQRGVGRRRRRPTVAAAVGGRAAPGRGVPRRARRLPDGATSAGRHQRRAPTEFRLARCACRATPTRTHRVDAGARRGPGGAARAGRGLRPHVVLRRAGRGRTSGCGSCRSTTWPARASWSTRATTGGASRWRTTRCTTPTRVTVARPVLRSTRRSWSDVDLATGGAPRRGTPRGPGPRPRGVRRETTDLPGPGRHARARRPWCGTATPRSTAPRPACSTATAPTSRVFEPEWDPALPEPARPRRRLRPRPRARRRRGRAALVARRPAGAQAAHLRRPRSPSPTGSPDGSSTAPGSRPAG